ncbi:GNAT family N-acetyltransferase [Frankia sp. R82]|uniref:GNAT family N-acetyltransferase n=1 Tax=Frankia sp. R82 TaxID=2950553 RepID=UPI0020440F9B|nr:GNAT family N-acetyltransferase [Frankia sp. R82]MCM3887305.1 N-acetyltransferase [Frankia sp. R82]
MSRRIANITLDNVDDLPLPCRRCVFWELDPVARSRAEEAGTSDIEKEAWLSSALLEWGSVGKIAYIDEMPVGFVMFAPPAYVPRSAAFPTSPVSPDAVLLMTALIIEEFQGQGLGRILTQAVAKDIQRRGFKAVEAFGDMQNSGARCVVPADYLLSVGFKTVRPHHRWPRLRLEVKNAVSWREDVEVALERLLGSMTPEGVLRKVGQAGNPA